MTKNLCVAGTITVLAEQNEAERIKQIARKCKLEVQELDENLTPERTPDGLCNSSVSAICDH